MTAFARFGAAVSALALATGAASPALAAGTNAGDTIVNNVTVNYQVGGVAQPSLSASDSLTVDRKVNLTVTEVGSATTEVSPGQLAAVTTFTVSNPSNAMLDFALAAANVGGDDFEVSNIRIYADTNADGDYDAGVDQQITYLDQVVEDANLRVFVLADIPTGEATGESAGVRLTATAHEATAAGSLGAEVDETPGADTTGVDTVFADTNADGNTARDGIHFDADTYTILAAALTATKTSRVVSDPFNGTTDPKMIPGAVIEYCIAVANAAGGTDATNVAISDTLPGQMDYEETFGVKVDGTVSGATCNADGAIAGSHAAGVVSGTIPSIAAGDTRTVLFRVTLE